ncbi:MAG: 4Fe-4S dicluster domain-containing protein [Promethearchaeota archaeon]|nr:MAG: 4Fe-4S dicluster domain-containing protein [Candidatus Lokiarchaeota archaeon]
MNEQNRELYQSLQMHLDKMPVGFPKTKSGVEISLLKKLFSSEEAIIATKLNFFPLSLKKIYRKLKKNEITIDELKQKLDVMVQKGLIMTLESNGISSYSNIPYLIGIWEMQLGRLTPEVASESYKYFHESYFENGYNKTGIPQMRTIPIEKAIKNESTVATYDQVRKIINNSDKIALTDCICRIGKDLIGQSCKKTDLRETCIMLGTFAKMRIENGLAKPISKKEALGLLEKTEKEGLVPQTSNSQDPLVICSCCGCCCEILSSQRKFEKSAQFFATNFHAMVNLDDCIGCGTCAERCNMDAKIILENNKHEINLDRCIGCGLCVPTCPQGAIKLIKKRGETIPPKNTVDTYTSIINKKADMARKLNR